MGGCCKRAFTSTTSESSPLTQPTLDVLSRYTTEDETFKVKFDREYNFVYNELTCQICQERLKKPMTMPCLTHSVCLPCAEGLWRNWLKERDYLICPTCGESGGKMMINNEEFVKVNSELENIMLAYEKERMMWYEEKKRSEEIVSAMKEDRKVIDDVNLVEITAKVGRLSKSRLKEFSAELLQRLVEGPVNLREMVEGMLVTEEGKGKSESETAFEKKEVKESSMEIETIKRQRKTNGQKKSKRKISPNTEQDLINIPLDIANPGNKVKRYAPKRTKKNSDLPVINEEPV